MRRVLLLSTVLLITITVCSAIPDTLNDMLLFEKFVKDYNRDYDGLDELHMRFKTFQKNLRTIDQLNARHPHATFGVNKFADWTEDEMGSIKLPKTSSESLARSCLGLGGQSIDMYPAGPIPDSYDWRTKGVVAPVKDQGQCASCWSFSTASVIESAYAIKTGNLITLSEQQMVDCSKGCCAVEGDTECNNGCHGGWMWSAMNDVITMGGLQTEQSYPYDAADEACRFDKSQVVVTISNYTCLSGPNPASEDNMASFLVYNGPLSIAFDSSSVQFYQQGVVVPAADGSTCSTEDLDHAVVIVGYGIDEQAGPYWIVRNSWSSSWGEQGYFRIARGVGACGLDTAVVFPVL